MDGDPGLVLLPKLLELDPEMRVVILTGYSSIATAVEAIKRGACNYLANRRTPMMYWRRCWSEHADLDTLVPENRMSVDRLQWEHIQRVLTEHEGNISATARALGMQPADFAAQIAKSVPCVAEPALNRCCPPSRHIGPLLYDRPEFFSLLSLNHESER